jgi:hypothetical protein
MVAAGLGSAAGRGSLIWISEVQLHRGQAIVFGAFPNTWVRRIVDFLVFKHLTRDWRARPRQVGSVMFNQIGEDLAMEKLAKARKA